MSVRSTGSYLELSASGAEFSPCGSYRYALWRVWQPDSPLLLFIGLNPSTADAANDDPTIRRCRDFASRWGFGGLLMANLFGYRATQPADLFASLNPTGPDNQRWLIALSRRADKVIAAWGNDGQRRMPVSSLSGISKPLYCLRQNLTGAPAHPLYVAASTRPRLFRWRGVER